MKESPREISDRLDVAKALIAKHQDPKANMDLVKALETILHPNHFFIYVLKEKQLLNRPKEANTDANILKKRISLGCELVHLLGKLDPGYTRRKGQLLKALTKDRLTLIKLEKGLESQDLDHQAEMAAEELKEMALCLKTS